ncbi:MAG TPA: isochorismate synthase [Aquiluna sp.]
MPLKINVRSVAVPNELDLSASSVFMRQGQLIIAHGEVLRIEAFGENRIAELSAKWKELIASSEIADQVGLPGSGVIALTSISFSANSAAPSVLYVPKTTLVIKEGIAFEITAENDSIDAVQTKKPSGVFLPGDLSASRFKDLVEQSVSIISKTELDKVVLSRDLVMPISQRPDLSEAVQKLHDRYPHCWTYAIADVFGASPELLLRAESGEVSARVLAGTAGRGTDPDVDRAIAEGLAHSHKNRHEHDYAAKSMVERLEPFCEVVEADSEPFSLALPDLWHLATDVRGKLKTGVTLLDVIAELHPTAAVAGTPRLMAQELIAELEPYDRAGYAGPVGWLSSDGSGELAIALRGGVIEKDQIRAFAGCGIVEESDPQAELDETDLKFRAVRHAFS